MFQKNVRAEAGLRMMVSQVKLVGCLTAVTSSLYLLIYLTLPRQESCRTSPWPGERTLHHFQELTVKDHSESPTTETSPEIFRTRNMSVLVRPERRTVLVEPETVCQDNTTTTLLIAVFSAPGNSVARAVVR